MRRMSSNRPGLPPRRSLPASGSTPTEPSCIFALLLYSPNEAARKALQTMNPAKYEYQSDLAKHYISPGVDVQSKIAVALGESA